MGSAGPWYVMTSEATDAPRAPSSSASGTSGSIRADVVFFRQAMVPALDRGRTHPDGGARRAVPRAERSRRPRSRRWRRPARWRTRASAASSSSRTSRSTTRWRGPPTRCSSGSTRCAARAMSSKVVRKRDAAEKVGVLGKVDGRLDVHRVLRPAARACARRATRPANCSSGPGTSRSTCSTVPSSRT